MNNRNRRTGRGAGAPWLASLVIMLWGWVAIAQAEAPVVLSGAEFAPIDLGRHCDVLQDSTLTDTLDSVRGTGDNRFTPAPAAPLNLGFTQAQIWLRFTLQFPTTMHHPAVLVLPKPLLDHVDLFSVSSSGEVARVVTGDAHPHATRPFDYRAFAFALAAQPGAEVRYYLRVHSPTSAIEVPLELMSATDFSSMAAQENFLFGGFFGVMFGLAVSALLLYALTRYSVFAAYCAYTIAFTMMVAAINGYGMQYLWPASPLAQQVLPTAFTASSILTGILFIRRFFTAPLALKRANPLMLLATAVTTAGAIIHVLFATQLGMQLVIGVAVALCPVVFALCIASLRSGDRVARYFLIGWTAYFVGVVAAALDMLGVIEHSVLSAYGLYFGALAEFVSLAVALGDRVRTQQRDREREIAAANASLAALNANLEHSVRVRTRELEARNRELSELAVRDSLTGLYNHSTAIELLEQLIQQSQRYSFPVAVIMVDLDNFKQLNDTYGHQAGDQVLEAMSQTLLDSVRGSDVVGRYGGEEFLIGMPHTDAPAAREYGERLLKRVREISLPGRSARHLTASVGVAVYYPHGQRTSAPELVRRADEALYRSKRDGRDRITVDGLSLVIAEVSPFVNPATPL